ncbi:MAG: NAD-dependent deacetylase [Clostridia bacterium]|nr:NAD-dependent deacetylase [Clostridia bacterium]NCC42565.1 NAD-dependent deacetylase [Clostridia bacterium]
MDKKIEALRRILDDSTYTVAIAGSGMMAEGGYISVKTQERAYEIEEKYGESPEMIFTSNYYNTRPEKFFRFYKNEMLRHMPTVTESAQALVNMERAGKLQCMITANIYSLGKRAGLNHVLEMYGNVYENKCSRCQRSYSMEYIRDAKGIPECEVCEAVIRPQINLFGEMVDSNMITRITVEIEKADTLLVLGTTLKSEVFTSYIRYFSGRYLVVIHDEDHFADHKADLTIIDQPKNVLPLLGY